MRSPIKVVCRTLLFGMKSCSWKPTGEFRAIEFASRKTDETAILHRSTKYAGKWQLSFFDDRGPVRDSQHSSAKDALLEVSPKRWRLRKFE